MKAVVTAGGRIEGAFAQAAGTSVKALAPVRGVTMLARMLDALRGAGVDEIAVVGGSEVRAACSSAIDRFVEESPSGSENLLRALRAWPSDERLLYATSDLPYVNAASVADFAGRVGQGTLAVALAEHAEFGLDRLDAHLGGLPVLLLDGGELRLDVANIFLQRDQPRMSRLPDEAAFRQFGFLLSKLL